MRCFISLWWTLLVLVIGHQHVVTADEDCPSLMIQAKLFPGRQVRAGKGHLQVTLSVGGATSRSSSSKGKSWGHQTEEPLLSNVDVKLAAPSLVDEVTLLKTSLGVNKEHAEVLGSNIYWREQNLRQGKKYTYKAKFRVDECAPLELSFDALVYLVNATGDPYCPQYLSSGPIEIPVVYPYSMDKKQGSLTCRPTPAPQVNPAAPYVEYPGQRCLQAGRLAPFDNTRRQRQLAVTINNPNECSTYCSLNGNGQLPLFFNWKETTNQCFCCGGECTLVADSDYSAYEALVTATRAPTRVPTTSPIAPTPSPSCPDLYAYDGITYRFETDMSGSGKMGLTSNGVTFRRPQGIDYHVLDTATVPDADGQYRMVLVEDRQEANFLDKVRFFAVDIPATTELREEYISNTNFGEQAITSVTRIVGSQPTLLNVTLIDTSGAYAGDVSTKVKNIDDGNYVIVGSSNPNDPEFAGLEIDLGPLINASRVVLIYRALALFPMNMNITVATEVANRRRNGERQFVQVFNGTDWVLPPGFKLGGAKGFYRTTILDLSSIVFPTADHRIRIMTLYYTIYDYFALDTDTSVSAIPYTAVELPLTNATLRYHGQVAPKEVGDGAITHPDYNEIKAVADPFIPGAYTRYGNVSSLASKTDDLFVIFGPGDELYMTFDGKGLSALATNMTRKFVFMTNTYYRPYNSPFLNVTLEPLPFYNMTGYPYNSSVEFYPTGEPYDSYRAAYNTRIMT